MGYNLRATLEEASYGDITEWTDEIVGGGSVTLEDIRDSYIDVVKDILYTAMEESGEEFSDKEEEEFIEEHYDSVIEVVAEDLVQGVIDELNLIQENVEDALNEFE